MRQYGYVFVMRKWVIGGIVVLSAAVGSANAHASLVRCKQDVVREYGNAIEAKHVGEADLSGDEIGKVVSLGGFWDSRSNFRTIHFELVTSNSVRVQLKLGEAVVQEGFLDLLANPSRPFLYEGVGNYDLRPITVSVSCRTN
jgi:hypothetical protein